MPRGSEWAWFVISAVIYALLYKESHLRKSLSVGYDITEGDE
jgi:hypothetical protein